MAMYSIIRRASSSVLPLAIRAVGSSSTMQRAISTGRRSHELSRTSFVPFLRFSTAVAEKCSADDKLIGVLESEIKSEESNEQSGIEEIPDGFPFKIQDNHGERTIFLQRVYQDEVIKVEVDMPNIETGEDEADDNGDNNDENDVGQCSIPLVVSISKGNGMHIEFGVTAFPEEISIDSLSIKKPDSSEDQLAYEGPEFSDLDENLQKAFLKYLEVRGIKPSTTNILYEYMVNKDNKEYLMWLKNLKEFVEK